jgi:ABC-type xylose transport system permease subunit
MIQRIQSVYLVLGALALAALFLFDGLWNSQAAALLVWFSPAVMALAAAAIVVAAVALFSYKDRKKQRKVVMGAQWLTVLLLLALLVGLYLCGELLQLGQEGAVLIVPILLPVLAYILFYLARRGIDKDIALIRSMDRLR